MVPVAQRGIRLARVMPFLGIDYGVGRVGLSGKFRKRMQKVRSRLKKVKRLGRFTSKAFLFKAGLGPSIYYPLPVLGLATGTVESVMRTFAANFSGWWPGNSSTLMLMFSGACNLDPLYAASLLPIVSWVKHFQSETYARNLMAMSWDFPVLRLQGAVRPWSLASGPAAATYLSPRRVEWDLSSAQLWISHRGKTFDISVCPLCNLVSEIKASIEALLRRGACSQEARHALVLARLSQSVGSDEAAEIDACTAPIFTLLGTGKKRISEPAERGALQSGGPGKLGSQALAVLARGVLNILASKSIAPSSIWRGSARTQSSCNSDLMVKFRICAHRPLRKPRPILFGPAL